MIKVQRNDEVHSDLSSVDHTISSTTIMLFVVHSLYLYYRTLLLLLGHAVFLLKIYCIFFMECLPCIFIRLRIMTSNKCTSRHNSLKMDLKGRNM